mmetsp:Transcript_25351/g.59399  ORF Transcript_25351/g.59399 Transcript_25351/m.59399 type:complete len:122 (-) Transcript_25351:1050-1415(-)
MKSDKQFPDTLEDNIINAVLDAVSSATMLLSNNVNGSSTFSVPFLSAIGKVKLLCNTKTSLDAAGKTSNVSPTLSSTAPRSIRRLVTGPRIRLLHSESPRSSSFSQSPCSPKPSHWVYGRH